MTYRLGDADVIVAYRPAPGGTPGGAGDGEDRAASAASRRASIASASRATGCGSSSRAGTAGPARVAVAGARAWVLSEGVQLVLVEVPRFAEPGAEAVAGGLIAPMPGRIVKILAEVGQEVAAARRSSCSRR